MPGTLATSALLEVMQPPAGWFLIDTQLQVLLDGRPLYYGSFASGFAVTVEVAIGPHVLETTIDPGGIGRRRRYDLVVTAPVESAQGGERQRLVAKLDYSRFWGNFSKKLDLR
jgi:hypothetical protein